MVKKSISDDQTNIIHIIGGYENSIIELESIGRSANYYIQYYESAAQLTNFLPRNGIIIIYDNLLGQVPVAQMDRFLHTGILLPVVLASHDPCPARIVEGIKAGAADYFALPISAESFVRRLTRVAAEARDMAAIHRKRIAARDRLAKLSRREREVLQCITLGNSSKAIARHLDISPRTVEVHRSNLLGKLRVQHAIGAIRICFDAGEFSVG